MIRVIQQPRCPARRKPTLWERVKMVLGWFEDDELQCHRYADHQNYPDQLWHRGTDRKEWLDDHGWKRYMDSLVPRSLQKPSMED